MWKRHAAQNPNSGKARLETQFHGAREGKLRHVTSATSIPLIGRSCPARLVA